MLRRPKRSNNEVVAPKEEEEEEEEEEYGQSSTGTRFPPCTFYLPCQYHSSNAPY